MHIKLQHFIGQRDVEVKNLRSEFMTSAAWVVEC